MATGLSVKQFMDLAKGDWTFDWDHATASTFKVALFKALTIDFSATTFSYGSAPFNANEQNGSGYTAGGMNVPGRTVVETGAGTTIIALTATYMEWNPITTVTLRNALFYKSTDSKGVGVWDLGTPADVTTGVVRLTFANDRMITWKMTP